ncbi:MAG: 4Fe-4S dicluster domain-containing protein, partial [Candidatus Eisenbacteria bacterium]
HEVDGDGGVHWFFRRQHCFHCTQAACIEACPVEPVKAMTRHPEFGTVYVNQNLCIGCGACVEACPYGVPHVNYDIEKSRKCTGCYDRVANDMLPACAKTCPTRAIRYGEKSAMYALAKARVKELKQAGWKDAHVYGVDQLGGLHSIYVLQAKLAVYELPAKPQFGSLEDAQRQGREKFAAWQREHGEKLADAAGGLGGATLLAGLAALGVQKLNERRARMAEEEAREKETQ